MSAATARRHTGSIRRFFRAGGSAVAAAVAARPVSAPAAHASEAQELAHLRRLGVALSRVHRAIVRARSIEELFSTVCRELVEEGGFTSAWVGRLNPASLEVSDVAGHGLHVDVARGRGLEAGDSPRGSGPTGVALREGRQDVSNDVPADPRMAPWRHWKALRSAAAFPLRSRGHVFGALSLYSTEAHFFGSEELSMLSAAAEDVSFALASIESDAERERAEENRRQAEEALRRSETSLRLAQRLAHIGSWEVDLVRRTMAWSEEMFRILGVAPSDGVPDPSALLDVVHPDDRDEAVRMLLGALATHRPASVDHRIVRPDGEERIVHEHGEIRLDRAGTPVALVGTTQDITELRRAELALGRSERELRTFLEHAQDIVLIVGPGGQVRFQSPSAERVLGYPAEQAIGRSLFTILHPEDRPHLEAMLNEAVDARLPFDLDVRVRHADGTWRTFQAVGTRTSGDPPEWVVNARDVTERRRLEEQLRQSQKMEAIGLLAGGVAHDFNNMLTVIHGNAALLLDAASLEPDDADLVQQVIDAAERAAELTRHLLTFSRKQVMRPANVDLNDIIAKLTKMLRRILGEDIALGHDFAARLPLVRADAGMIEQVLLNMAINARDAMPRGGRLVIGTSGVRLAADALGAESDLVPGEYACMTVADTGTGISPEHLPHIFEPFFTTKEAGKGTGLGLATVYGIVRQHRGRIEVRSEAGHGTTFLVYLPAMAGEKDETGVAAFGGLQPSGRHQGVLLVEDEPAVLRLAESVLKRCGYEVLGARSAAAALDVWHAHKDAIEIVVTDMIMPGGMTGRELAERLRAERAGLPVIFTSGYSPDANGASLMPLEDSEFLAKPYEPAVLAGAVRKALDTAQRHGRPPAS